MSIKFKIGDLVEIQDNPFFHIKKNLRNPIGIIIKIKRTKNYDSKFRYYIRVFNNECLFAYVYESYSIKKVQ